MKQISLQKISEITDAKLIGNGKLPINDVVIDSRKVFSVKKSIFFALAGKRNHGHNYIPDLVEKGVNCFVVEKVFSDFEKFPQVNFIVVKNSLLALQKLALFFRNEFENQLIAITGSNGKTIVKEWLFHVLHRSKKIIRSPKSYNSQIGVALSLLLLENNYDTAIIEAGISEIGEMQKLANIIKPKVGIFTTISNAHQENFPDIETKISEKLKLFSESDKIIYCADYELVDKVIKENLSHKKTFSWSKNKNANLIVSGINKQEKYSEISLKYQEKNIKISIPFTDNASIENSITVLAFIISENLLETVDLELFKSLPSVEMRLEIKKGINNCTIINDSYNSDFNSLKIAIELLHSQNQHKKKTLILSDFLQLGFGEKKIFLELQNLLLNSDIKRFIAIGKSLKNAEKYFENIKETSFFETTNDFIQKISKLNFNNEAILIKGARNFHFEQISDILQEKKHRTVFEINLEAILHNLNYYRSLLSPKTKIMIMVKAFSYGSGTYEIANLLQYQNVDYLGVAFADEGVMLRKGGITSSIMVMNPDEESFHYMPEYNLEPEIYSINMLRKYSAKAGKYSNKKLPVHIKIDTGMKRLGFCDFQIDDLISEIKSLENIQIKSIFSHLVGTDESIHDKFTLKQITDFEKLSNKIINTFDYKIIRHILNSSGIERFAEYEFDMVRLGIGLYGFSPNNQEKLMNVGTFKSKISQIKKVKAGDTIGYSRKGKADTEKLIAIIPVGYADGLSRALSNGIGEVLINEQLVSIIGNVCMDMFMADISEIKAEVGDDVIIFGDKFPANIMADKLKTISYEIITGISERVKRVYYQ